MGFAHERFADEEGVVAGIAEKIQILGGVDAALGNMDGTGGQAFCQRERGVERDVEGMQVAVVHAISIAAERADAVEFLPCVHFAEHVEFVAVGYAGEVEQLLVGKGGGNQQDGVGPWARASRI